MNEKVQTPDTIAAVATPAGRGAIGIIRLSGPQALEIAGRLFRGRHDPRDLPGFTFTHGWIEYQGERLDEVLCLVMRAPKSYTREDMVEFHCHGGPLPLQAVFNAVLALGARPAAPGEFTRRAFLAGRIDLAQAEAVADLIASETEAARRLAAAQLTGELSRSLAALREELNDLLARLEAGIDFPEEEDVVFIAPAELQTRLHKLEAELDRLLASAHQGLRFREGARVVIAGKPNVGKSTLMNALLRTERVIVTAEPGTTRDVIEDILEIHGIPVRLLDTAGLHPGTTEAEQMGVARARAELERADLVLLVLDASQPLAPEDRESRAAISSSLLLVLNKCDLPLQLDPALCAPLAADAPLLQISALTGQGLDRLEEAIARALLGSSPSSEAPLIASRRHYDALCRARHALQRGRTASQNGYADEFCASDLRAALAALGEITGETAAEEILDRIFSRFCIGK